MREVWVFPRADRTRTVERITRLASTEQAKPWIVYTAGDPAERASGGFHFYFEDEVMALAVVPVLEREGLDVDVHFGVSPVTTRYADAGEVWWHVIGKASPQDRAQIRAFHERFEHLAERLDAWYDGHY